MTLGDLFLARRTAPFLRGHDERRYRGRRAERRLVSVLLAVCGLQVLMLGFALLS